MRAPRLAFVLTVAVAGFGASPSSAGEPDVCRDRASVMSAIGDAGCSALLVSRNRALTAAHCIDPRRHELRAISFRAGAARRDVAVTRCEAHPRFDGVSADHDVALCWLKEPVDDVTAVELSASAANARVGEPACVIGFQGAVGSRHVSGRAARVKQQPTATTARLAFESCAGDRGDVHGRSVEPRCSGPSGSGLRAGA
jgi:hypothetical protein